MSRRQIPPALVVLAVLVAGAVARPAPVETYTLPNGLTVVLQEDHRLPTAVIATRFAVGSKDEAPGRTGFAHLFEHLMFMGTHRVPGNQFDMIMEGEGGENNASTSEDRTTYYSWGPVEILPTLMWLDADRLQQLGDAMTQEKLDLQRNVVRNERRQGYENRPYGVADLALPEMLWPQGHPYRHTVIGEHADLEAATLSDVKDFFATWYVPGNAVLAVVGDFDAARARETIATTFGAVPASPLPPRPGAAPVKLDAETRRLLTDNVDAPKLILAWHSPALYAEGDAALTLVGRLLAGSPSARLNRRLQIDRQLAREVDAYQDSRELGSAFTIEVVAAPGADLEEIKRETLAAIAELQRDGPAPDELGRLQAVFEAGFRRRAESMLGRAVSLTDYRHALGQADAFEWDLARYATLTPAAVRDAARASLGAGRADLRVLPKGADVAGADLDQRPSLYEPRPFSAPAIESFRLSNGLQVDFAPRPGCGLIAGSLVATGGDRLLPAQKAGLAALTAEMLTAGAAGRDAAGYAAAVEALGASIEARAGREALTVSLQGLAPRLDATLDLLADAVLRPNLASADFDRERKLLLARLEARAEEPRAVSRLAAAALLHGREDWRGRPLEGWSTTVGALTLDDVRAAAPLLLDPARARLVFVGDVTRAQLEESLAQRFGKWKGKGGRAASDAASDATEPPSAGSVAPGNIALVDRPGAPQTVIRVTRALNAPDAAERADRLCVTTLLGGTFTSRLNQNLREKHGYTYGAGCAIEQEGSLHTLGASSSVQTAVTGAALDEFRREFEGLATGNVTDAEASKAVLASRRNLIEVTETAAGLARSLTAYAIQGRPIDSLQGEIDAVEGVDVARANAYARSGIHEWNGLLVVLVGDRETILPQLRAAGFPEPIAVDAEGRLLAP